MTSALVRAARVLAFASTGALAVGAAWYTVEAWPTADGGALVVIGTALVVGLGCSAAALLLVWEGRWAWAAAGAALAAVTPTGFAYLGNGMTLALAFTAGWLAVAARREARARS